MHARRISNIGLFIVSEMTENPTVKYVKFWFRATPLINFGHSSVIVSVASNLAVLQIMHFFSDLVLFQLKRTCLQKFKKSLQKKNMKKNLFLVSNLHVTQPTQGSGPHRLLISLVDYKLAGPSNFLIRGSEDPQI